MCDYMTYEGKQNVSNFNIIQKILRHQITLTTENYTVRPVLKEIIYSNILELSLTRSIARKPQPFGGFKKICPAEVEASTKARLSE